MAGLLIAAALIAMAWALSLFIRFALSRSREYLADAGAVELTKNPDAMIGALSKIAGKGELPDVPSGLMEMCIDNPRSGFADLFATHPSIEDRIAALVRYAGGHAPEPAPQLPSPPCATRTRTGIAMGACLTVGATAAFAGVITRPLQPIPGTCESDSDRRISRSR